MAQSSAWSRRTLSGFGAARWRGAGGWRETVAVAAIVLALPTIVYGAISALFGFLGPILNLDLLLLYAAGVLLARRWPVLAPWAVVAGIAYVLGVQILAGIGAIYIEDLGQLRDYVGFVAQWPWRLIGVWGLFAAVALAVVFDLVRRIEAARAHIWPAIIALAVLIVLDKSALADRLFPSNVATSSLRTTEYLLRLWLSDKAFQAHAFGGSTMAVEAGENPPSRIVSIAVESLGFAQDDRFNAAMFAPMRAILRKGFDVRIERHGYKGATLAGELRELCGIRVQGTPGPAQVDSIRRFCLPGKLAAKGYRTLGIHGNSRFFFRRYQVYPGIGFQDTRFYEDFISGPRPAAVCTLRGFEGACDDEGVRAALGFVAAAPKRYAHFMTLETHLPLAPNHLGDRTCGRVPGLDQADLCLYVNQMANLLAQIGRQIATAPTPPDVVYLFGDHAPPFAVAGDRAYFDRAHVPYIVIRRREPGGLKPPIL